jgi:PII-like signaling protein
VFGTDACQRKRGTGGKEKDMAGSSKGAQITVYFGEADQWQHQSLALALLHMLRREGCSGATITRGVAGFGAESRIKTTTILALSFDLPMVLTVVDTPERVAHLLPTLREMLGGGLITVEDVELSRTAGNS